MSLSPNDSKSTALYTSNSLKEKNFNAVTRFKIIKSILLVLFALLSLSAAFSQTTSWTGTRNGKWSESNNWTNGVPNRNMDVIIGDVNFTGSHQPDIKNVRGNAECLSLTIGTGAIASTLGINDDLIVFGDVEIGANGTIDHDKKSFIVLGDWNNSGLYDKKNNGTKVYFAGSNQTITGSSTTDFGKLYITSGTYLTLDANVNISGELSLSGTLDPTANYSVSGTGQISIEAYGQLVVRAATFSSNYSHSGGTNSVSGLAYINYASNTIDQTVAHDLGDDYEILVVSGTSTKTLSGNLNINGALLVYAGATLDIENYTVDGNAGQLLVVYGGSTLKIGGTNTFPANFTAKSLAVTSTVEYYGTNQVVSAEAYGNLTLSGTAGGVVKTMPSDAFSIAGNFTSSAASGDVSFTAGNSIDVQGSINLGSNTTFGGGTFSHTLNGDWVNNGTFNGCSSTYTFEGTNKSISGSGANNFGDVVITGSGITMVAATSATVCGNFSTTQNGSFTHTTGGAGLITFSGTSKSISGSNLNFDDLLITGTISTSATFNIVGNLTSDNDFTANGGTIDFTGTGKTISGTGGIQFASLNTSGSVTTARNISISSNFSVSGSFVATAATTTFNGTSAFDGEASLFNVEVSAANSLTMGSSSTLKIAGTSTLGAGSAFNTSDNRPNTVVYNGSGAQSIGLTSFSNLVVTNGDTKTPLGALVINDNLTIESATTFDASTFTHTINGDFTNEGTFTKSSSTISFVGTSNSTITGVTTFNTLEVNKTSGAEVMLADDITTSNATMTAGVLDTDVNSITITTDRSGSGYIYGSITRTHAFTTGTNYTFEGPNNFISFSSIVGAITSITVDVEPGKVETFPSRSSVNRQYEVTLTGGSSYVSIFRAHYEESELNGNTEANLTLWNDQGTASWADESSSGKNSTENWVELSGLNSLPNKWTFAGGNSVISWVGTTSSAWNVASNWSSGTVPTSTDIVYVGDQTFTNQPEISTAVEIKSIVFNSTTATTITLSTGGSLVVNGNIYGIWTSDAVHTIDVGDQTFSANSEMFLSNNVSNRNVNIAIDAGTLNAAGQITQNGSSIAITTGTLNISSNFNYSAGTFTSGTGSVVYQGSGRQEVAFVDYYNLTFSKSDGVAQINSATTIANDFTVSTGGSVEVDAPVSVAGNVLVDTGATLHVVNNDTIDVAKNWTVNGSFDAGSGVVLFNGTLNQNVSVSHFNNFRIDKTSGEVILTGDITIDGDVNLANGTVDLSTYNITRTAAGGQAVLGANCMAKFNGAGLQLSNFAALVADPTSTVQFGGTSNRIIPPISYGHVIISNSTGAIASLVGATDIQGDLTVNSGAILSVGASNLTLNGNLAANGTLSNSTGGIVLNGTNKTVTGDITFNDLTINGSYDYTSGSIVCDGNIQISSTGDFDLGSIDATFNGDLTNAGTVFSSGEVTFSGTTQQTLTLQNAVSSTSTGVVNFNGTVAPVFNSTSSPVFATVNINNTDTIVASQPWYVAVTMNVASGATWNDGGLTHTFTGAFINSGEVISTGNLVFSPSVSVPVALGNSFSSEGKVEFGGSGLITLSGANPSFTSVEITNTNAAGLSAVSNWTVNNFAIEADAEFNAGSYDYTVSGSWINKGVFNGQTSTVTFTSTSLENEIAGSGESSFNNIVFGNASSLTISTTLGVTGNLTNNGTNIDLSNASVEFTGTGNSTIGGTTSSVFDELVVNKTAATVQLSNALSVNSFVSLDNGVLDLNANTITVINPDTLAINRSSGYILSENTSNSSRVDWAIGTFNGPHTFPFGNSAGDYIPLTIDLSAGDAGTVSVATYATGNDNLPLPATVTDVNSNGFDNSANTIDRFFQIDLSGETSPVVDVTFTASASEVGSITSLQAQRWNGTTWDEPLPGQSATANSVTVPGVTQFSPWTMSGNGEPLPVELLSFNASSVDGEVELSWATSTEINNDYFEVQHSANGVDFITIGKVSGAGNSNSRVDYYFVHRNPVAGRNYYRLNQVDFDYQSEISQTIMVESELLETEISVYPNPTPDFVYITTTRDLDYIDYELYDARGMKVPMRERARQLSQQKAELNLQSLVSGSYILTIREGEHVSYHRLIKQ